MIVYFFYLKKWIVKMQASGDEETVKMWTCGPANPKYLEVDA